MKFDKGINKKYRKSVEDAFQTILDKGNDFHREMMNYILASNMLVRVKPVSEINNASGVTGLINSLATNLHLKTGRMNLQDALGEICIAIAEETIDTGGQQGCEGTFVHEGRHAYDFAQTLASFSNSDINPLGIFNPTLYDLEWEAHQAGGKYMLCINQQPYIDEGLQLMLLGQAADGTHFVSDDGIKQRLRDSYGLALDGNVGPLASEMMGVRV